MILLRPYWKSKRGNILHQVVLLVPDESGGIKCNRDKVYSWEKFTIG